MKKVILVTILLLVAGGILGYLVLRERAKTDLAFNSKMTVVTDKIYALRDTAIASGKKFKKILSKGEKILKNAAGDSSGPGESGKSVELHLKHGGVIKGRLLRESGDQYVVNWGGNEFAVKKNNVKSVKNITQRDIEWPYKNDIVIKKTNGVICDGKIVGFDDKAVTLSFEEGGGEMEMGVPRPEISYLVFAPVCNKDTDETKSTLRHELTHEIFHNWGLQTIITSKPTINKEKLLEKRKKFIEAADWESKKKLLDEMMDMERPEEIEMAVAESWLAEGLATYCATEPIGGIDTDLLFTFQDAVNKKELNPIEFFTNFEKGSFVGTVSKSKYSLYAQSWAFTCFLMAKYPIQFADYQGRIAEKAAKEDKKDNLSLLLECLGKNLTDLEKEFNEYMLGYQKAEDPYVKRYIELYSVWKDLLESHF